MRVEAVPEWRLGPREAEVAALLARCFATDFGGRSFFKQRHHLRLLGRDEGGALLGHVALTWRAVGLGGRLLDVAGLAEVATAPERRGEGVARALVGRAVEEARASPASHLLLFGDAGLYGALGFRAAANPVTHVRLRGGFTLGLGRHKRAGLMVLPLGSEEWDEAAPLDLMGPLF